MYLYEAAETVVAGEVSTRAYDSVLWSVLCRGLKCSVWEGVWW